MIDIYRSNTLGHMKDTTVRANKYLPKFVPIVSILLIACVSIIGCLRTILPAKENTYLLAPTAYPASHLQLCTGP